jgi:hypothetical protein
MGLFVFISPREKGLQLLKIHTPLPICGAVAVIGAGLACPSPMHWSLFMEKERFDFEIKSTNSPGKELQSRLRVASAAHFRASALKSSVASYVWQSSVAVPLVHLR